MAEEAKQGEKKDEKIDIAKDAGAVEVPAKFTSIVAEIEKMSVLDLSELVKLLEDKFNVSAAAPVAAVAVNGADAAGDDVEEKSAFDIEITEAGPNKIAVIKVIREISDKGLKEAKDLVDAAPKVIAEAVAKEEAEAHKAKLEEAGAQVTLK